VYICVYVVFGVYVNKVDKCICFFFDIYTYTAIIRCICNIWNIQYIGVYVVFVRAKQTPFEIPNHHVV